MTYSPVPFWVERDIKRRTQIAHVPQRLVKHIVPYTTVEFMRARGLLMLDQRIKLNEFTLWIQRVEAKRKTRLLVKTKYTTRSVQMMRSLGTVYVKVKGGPTVQLQGNRPGYYNIIDGQSYFILEANQQLREGFIRHYSMRIDTFIRMIKMHMVFELLTEKATPLPLVAAAAGFDNWAVLDKAFKSYYGCEMEVLRRAM